MKICILKSTASAVLRLHYANSNSIRQNRILKSTASAVLRLKCFVSYELFFDYCILKSTASAVLRLLICFFILILQGNCILKSTASAVLRQRKVGTCVSCTLYTKVYCFGGIETVYLHFHLNAVHLYGILKSTASAVLRHTEYWMSISAVCILKSTASAVLRQGLCFDSWSTRVY